MSGHVLLNLLSELEESDKLKSILLFCQTSLINSMIHEHN